MAVRLRPATPADSRQVFRWRNDPFIVALSASQRTVTAAEHDRWFARILDRDWHLLFLVEDESGTGMGTVRIDYEGAQRATATIYLLSDFVGQGVGVPALRAGCAQAFEHWADLQRIYAYIRSDNVRSVRTFARVGFVQTGHTAEEELLEMMLSRPQTATTDREQEQ